MFTEGYSYKAVQQNAEVVEGTEPVVGQAEGGQDGRRHARALRYAVFAALAFVVLVGLWMPGFQTFTLTAEQPAKNRKPDGTEPIGIRGEGWEGSRAGPEGGAYTEAPDMSPGVKISEQTEDHREEVHRDDLRVPDVASGGKDVPSQASAESSGQRIESSDDFEDGDMPEQREDDDERDFLDFGRDDDDDVTDASITVPYQESSEGSTLSYSDLEARLVRVYTPDNTLVGPIDACHPNRTRKVPRGSREWDVLAADCGLGYNWENSTSRRRPWTVALYGGSFVDNILTLSGCLVGKGKCPFSPRCEFTQTESANVASRADVVVMFQNDAHLVDSLGPRRPGQSRVLYWREAFYAAPSPGAQRKFDFEMGVHWQSMVLNPQFFRTPAALLGGITYPHRQVIPFLPVRARPHFAMSVYSNCHPASRRDIYIKRLVDYLGPKRVHQYGRCGNLELPPPPIKNAAKIIAGYKFYLSFENTIEDGYVTEKLLHLLAMPVVPVYYGSPRVFNITKTPSFIRANDFSHPKLLADYLLYLDGNDAAYYEYHRWRTSPEYFHEDYLKMMAIKSPGVYEMLALRNRGGNLYPRSAACCRLCDGNYVNWARENREHFVQHRLSKSAIERRYFQGNFWGEPASDDEPGEGDASDDR